MKKNARYLLILVLCTALVLTAGLSSVLAADYWNPIQGTTDWVAMGGNEVDDVPTPADVVINDSGLMVTYTGGEYVAGGSNAGVMYAKPVDLSNFSIEFTVTKRADDYRLDQTGCDSWISLCLLNKPDKYFNTKRAGESQGIVTLIRPMGEKTAFELTALSNSFANNSMFCHEHNGDMKASFKVEIKMGDDGLYDYYVNGVLADYSLYSGRDFSKAFTRMMESGDVYLYMGVSSKDSSQQIQWTITKINGQPVKADAVVDPQPTETDPVDPQPTETEPVDPQPTETEPTEPEPTETEPTEPEPTETEPTEPEPTEPEPTEPEPTESKPAENEPTESKPADSTPAATDPVSGVPGDGGDEDGFPVWIPIVLVAAAAVVVVVILVIKKKK